MKRISLFLVTMLCCGMIATAMPAKPGWQKLTQSDGTTLTVQAVGNAFRSAILTTDGLMVERGKNGDFYYRSSLTGRTAMRAHDEGLRTPAEMAFIQAQRSNLTINSIQRPMSNRQNTRFGVGGSNADAGVPANGNRKIPIILVEFKDKKFNNTRQDIINAMLTGNKSVGQYFSDQSNGVYQPDFDVYGIYTLSQNREYYGGHSGNDNDKGLGYMVTEACQLAAADGVSFRPYDTNGDNYCDVVIVIYAGVGEAQSYWNHPEAIWPCNWYLSSASYYGQGGNGAFCPNSGDPYVDMFAVFNELHGSNDDATTIDGIGTFAHEFSHCLGLPDFYDTGNGGHYGMGYWSLMCSGCYNDDTYTPVGYSAYEKAFMGWINYVDPRPGTYYTLPVWNQKSAATDKAVRIVSDLNQNEFFIIENRKRQGWDRYIAADGLLITHITYSADRWTGNTPNNQDVQLITFIPADNNISNDSERTDLWPQGSQNAFTDNSTPPARLYMRANGNITSNAGLLGKPVTEMVINEDGTASFWYMKDSATNPVISVSTDALDMGNVKMNNSASKTFNVIGQALTGNVTLTLNDPNGVFGINPTVLSSADASLGHDITVTFAPQAIRDYSATVTLSTPGGQNVVVNLTGHGLIEGYTPVMQPANEAYINLTQFRADWTDQTPAQNVASYTLEVSPKPTVELLETADFSTVPDAVEDNYLVDVSSNYADYLPQGWSGTSYMGAYGGAIIQAFEGSVKSPTYNFTGYDKVTVVVRSSAYYYDDATISVSTSVDTQQLSVGNTYADYTVVLDCADLDAVTIQNVTNYDNIKSVTIYAGDLTTVSLRASEEGGQDYRYVTGITDKFYLVRDLLPEGTFIYKVKTVYSDGTESPWSNVETVTLFANGHGYALGDVNHDGDLDVSDVTMIIGYILGEDNGCCDICANVDQDDNATIDVGDVTTLINLILTNQ